MAKSRHANLFDIIKLNLTWISLFENVRFSFFNLQLPLPVLPIDH